VKKQGPSFRRVFGTIIVVLVLLGGAAYLQGIRSPATTPPVAAPAGLSDGALETMMVETLNNVRDSTAAIPRDGSGSPDIAVRGGVLFVATNDPSAAAELCRTVAGMMHDPDTGAALPISAVAVIQGNDKLADCRP
jgi:hypothetical protein